MGLNCEKRACILGTPWSVLERVYFRTWTGTGCCPQGVWPSLLLTLAALPCLGLQLSSALTCLVKVLLADGMTLKATLFLYK